MQIGRTTPPMQSALDLIHDGEQRLGKASEAAASGNLENLAQTLVDLSSARQTVATGVVLARASNETTGYLLDMLA